MEPELFWRSGPQTSFPSSSSSRDSSLLPPSIVSPKTFSPIPLLVSGERLPTSPSSGQSHQFPGAIISRDHSLPLIPTQQHDTIQGHIRAAPLGVVPSYVLYGVNITSQPPPCHAHLSTPSPSISSCNGCSGSPSRMNFQQKGCNHEKLQCITCHAEFNGPILNKALPGRSEQDPNIYNRQKSDEYSYSYERSPPRHCACPDDGCILNHEHSSHRYDRHKTRRHYSCKTATRILTAWIQEHPDKPYPEREEKIKLAKEANMTLRQLQDWFGNARRRLKRQEKATKGRNNRISLSSPGLSDDEDEEVDILTSSSSPSSERDTNHSLPKLVPIEE